jgi:hypothetical protein
VRLTFLDRLPRPTLVTTGTGPCPIRGMAGGGLVEAVVGGKSGGAPRRFPMLGSPSVFPHPERPWPSRTRRICDVALSVRDT